MTSKTMNELDEALRILKEVRAEILRLRAACQHDYAPSDPAWIMASHAECKLCGDWLRNSLVGPSLPSDERGTQ